MSFFLPFIPDKETSQEVESLGNQLVTCIVGATSSVTLLHRSVVCVWGWGERGRCTKNIDRVANLEVTHATVIRGRANLQPEQNKKLSGPYKN